MKKTLAQRIREDERFLKGKQLILAALQDHQEEVTHRGPKKGLSSNYESLLQNFAKLRGGGLWYPYLGSGFGKGALVEMEDGSIKYDFINGIGVHVGHNLPGLVASSLDAAIENTVMQGHLQQNSSSYWLSKQLTELCQMDHCLLSTSGAMACENAIKMALQAKFPKQRILAFENCFMGRTLSLSQVSDKPMLRQGLPLNLPVDYLPFYDEKEPEKSLENTLIAAEKIFKRYPCSHAVMCMELVQGEGGFYPGSEEFFSSLIKLLKAHDVAILVDEVQSFGRFPELLASKYFNLLDQVDLLTIGKITQVCATLFHTDFAPKPGLISQTFTGSTSSIYASKYILDTLMSPSYRGKKGKIEKMSAYFREKLHSFSKEHPHLIQGPFGVGMMLAFTPLDGKKDKVLKVLQDLFSKGIIAFVCGSDPARIRFLPPVIGLEKDDIDASCEILFTLLKSY